MRIYVGALSECTQTKKKMNINKYIKISGNVIKTIDRHTIYMEKENARNSSTTIKLSNCNLCSKHKTRAILNLSHSNKIYIYIYVFVLTFYIQNNSLGHWWWNTVCGNTEICSHFVSAHFRQRQYFAVVDHGSWWNGMIYIHYANYVAGDLVEYIW